MDKLDKITPKQEHRYLYLPDDLLNYAKERNLQENFFQFSIPLETTLKLVEIKLHELSEQVANCETTKAFGEILNIILAIYLGEKNTANFGDVNHIILMSRYWGGVSVMGSANYANKTAYKLLQFTLDKIGSYKNVDKKLMSEELFNRLKSTKNNYTDVVLCFSRICSFTEDNNMDGIPTTYEMDLSGQLRNLGKSMSKITRK